MSDQPHRLDPPNRLDLPQKKRNQPHRRDERHQSHRLDERDQSHRLDERDQPNRLASPLEKRDQSHRHDLTLDPSRQLELTLDKPCHADLPPVQDELGQPPSQASSVSESGQSSSPSESVSDDSLGSTDSPPEPKKICYTCAQFLPASQFRFRNRTTGVRMTECRTCYNKRTKDWHRKKRAREKGWEIHKTASQIARSTTLARTLALLENLVDVMGGPEKLIEQWHNECWKLTNQKRSSTRLTRMHEMLIVLMGQTHRSKHQRAAGSPPKAAS